MNILEKVNQSKSYGYMYLLKNMAQLSFLRMNFDESEKSLLRSIELSNVLNNENVQN